MWEDVKYERGEIEVVAYDNNGNETARPATLKVSGKGLKNAIVNVTVSE